MIDAVELTIKSTVYFSIYIYLYLYLNIYLVFVNCVLFYSFISVKFIINLYMDIDEHIFSGELFVKPLSAHHGF